MKHPIPLEVTQQHLGIVGRTGAGKTYTAKGLVEQLLDAGRRVVILDPTGAWWGLRSRADGTPGYALPVIGGEHGNVPLDLDAAERLAGWLTEKPRSAVLDLSEMLIGERHRFVERFTDALYRGNRTPLHLVIDEADEFAPQNPLPETKRMLHHVDRIVRRGRIRGFRVMMITQRPAVLHKNVLTQINALVAMRLTAPQDRKAIEAWVEGNGDAKASRAVLDSLASLKRGEGWVWAPEADVLERVTFPPIATFDSSRSPEDGDVVAEPRAAVDVEEISGLRELLATPEAEPDDGGEDLAQLRRELAHERERNAESQNEGFRRGVNACRYLVEGLRARFDEFANWFQIIDGPLPSPERLGGAQSASLTEPEGEPRTVTVCPPITNAKPETVRALGEMARAAVAKVHSAAADLPRGEASVLQACIQYPEGLRREQLTVLTGYKRSSRDAYIQRLRERGLVTTAGDRIAATALGRKALPNAAPLPTGRALQQFWLARLPAGEREILQQLIHAWPKAIDREKLSQATGYKRSSRDAYLQRLRAKEIVDEPARGQVRASDDLFGGGR